MVIANFLLSASVYMQIPVMPQWLEASMGFTAMETGVSMGIFGIGIFAIGPVCSYLVQRYRRNLVCIWAIAAMAICIGILYYIDRMGNAWMVFYAILIQRFTLGAFFGLAKMILSSTLIIDTSESFQRTEANYISAWFSRFALSIGPMVSLVTYSILDFRGTVIVSAVCALVSIVLIKAVKFPFRAPEDNIKMFSLDRFFLPQSILLFLNLMIITVVVGLVFTLGLTFVFYGMMMTGFFLALMSQRFVFQNAELKSEVITGLIMIGGALLMMLTRTHTTVTYIAPLLFGCGIGIIGSRFLLFFIKLSRHCQRGTSQSTFMLGRETGIALGMWVGYSFLHNESDLLLTIAIGISVLALFMYNLITHKWFISNKNR